MARSNLLRSLLRQRVKLARLYAQCVAYGPDSPHQKNALLYRMERVDNALEFRYGTRVRLLATV